MTVKVNLWFVVWWTLVVLMYFWGPLAILYALAIHDALMSMLLGIDLTLATFFIRRFHNVGSSSH